MSERDDLVRDEDETHAELMAVLRGLAEGQLAEPGYNDDWSAKDMLAHLAAWMANSTQAMEQIRMGTFRPEDRHIDVDAMNEEFYRASRDLSLSDVRSELASARNRMLEEFGRLDDEQLAAHDRYAEFLFREDGPEHVREHLPRLREWARELAAA